MLPSSPLPLLLLLLVVVVVVGGSNIGSRMMMRRNPPDVVRHYRTLGERIYQHEVALSKQQQSGGGGSSGSGRRDEAWVESTMRRGTLKDRIAAMSVVVSSHPVHKLYALDMLLNMVGINIDKYGHATAKASGRPNDQGIAAGERGAAGSLDQYPATSKKEVGGVGRQAAPAVQQQRRAAVRRSNHRRTKNSTLSPRVLLLWRYEEHLRTRYSAYVELYLSRTSDGTDGAGTDQNHRPEDGIQPPEAACRRGNQVCCPWSSIKLAIRVAKVASAAGHQLRLVLEDHPAMMDVVATGGAAAGPQAESVGSGSVQLHRLFESAQVDYE